MLLLSMVPCPSLHDAVCLARGWLVTITTDAHAAHAPARGLGRSHDHLLTQHARAYPVKSAVQSGVHVTVYVHSLILDICKSGGEI